MCPSLAIPDTHAYASFDLPFDMAATPSELVVGQRIFINSYRIDDSERGGFLNLARGALREQPTIPGFAFQIYAHPDDHDYFSEIFVMPDPGAVGTGSAIEAYHFSSSYQPERDTCIQVGSRIISFRGTHTGDIDDIALESEVMRYSPLSVTVEEKDELLSAISLLDQKREYQLQMISLSSTEFPGKFALLEFFSTVGDFQNSEKNPAPTDEGLVSALQKVHEAVHSRDDLPAAFVRFR